MTIFFNLEDFIKVSKKRSLTYTISLGLLCNRTRPKTKHQAFFLEDLKKSRNRTSFLIYPERVLADNKTLEEYKDQYILLAAHRDYTLYKVYKDTTLPLSYFPEFDSEKLRLNPIIEITINNTIKFKYED